MDDLGGKPTIFGSTPIYYSQSSDLVHKNPSIFSSKGVDKKPEGKNMYSIRVFPKGAWLSFRFVAFLMPLKQHPN